MPPIEGQLPPLRALWPGPLVCRWNLHRKHGAFGYEHAVARYGEFERMQDPDPETRQALARVIRATSEAGYRSYVTVNNKAEGSAPMSVRELARCLGLINSSPPTPPRRCALPLRPACPAAGPPPWG